MGHHQRDVDDEYAEERGGGGFVSGVLLGGLLGVGVGLLLAPASGETTRNMLRTRAVAVRDEAVQKAEEVKTRARALETSSLEMLEAQKNRVARTAEAVKQSAQEAWASGAGDTEPAAVSPASSMNVPHA